MGQGLFGNGGADIKSVMQTVKLLGWMNGPIFLVRMVLILKVGVQTLKLLGQ